MKTHVVVIGGGFAGASAASALAEQGVSVTLLEKRAILGGRASSLRDGVAKEDSDNGQHLFIGGYRETRRFLKRLNVENRLRFLPRLEIPFLSPSGRSVLSAPSWPFSAGLPAGILGFRAMRRRDRWALLRGLAAARFSRRKDLSSLTVTQWLDALRQPPGARRAFWTPFCLATLNAGPDQACAAALDVVLREGVFAGPEARALGYSTVSLGKLWPVELPGYLRARGCVVSTEQTVSGLDVKDGRVSRVRLAGGGGGEADAVLCALPLPAFLDVCPAVVRGAYADLETIEYSPILSVTLWFDRPVTNDLFAGVLDTGVQWMFNRTALWGRRAPWPGCVTLTISNAREFAHDASARIVERVLEDLRRVLPDVPAPRHASVVWERQATPTPTPVFWKARPPAATPLDNLFLAGDWVDSGLPPTIEAACRSGHAAASAVRRYLDKLREKEPLPC